MKTTLKLGLLVILTQCVFAGRLQAQVVAIGNSSEGAAQPDSVVCVAAEMQGLQAVAYGDLPPFGTYWEVMPGGFAAPLPCQPFDLTLPVYAITDNIYLVDATYGQLVVNPRQTAMMSATSATTAAAQTEATAVVNLINFVQTAVASQQTRSMAMDGGLSGPPGFDDTDTNSYSPYGLTNSISPADYGTNLCIIQTAVAAGYLNATASNTIADISYEIQSRTNLTQTDWQSEGFFSGSELTNWTPFTVFQAYRANLFLRLRSWADTYDIGIPDWWQIEYFGTNGIDPNASAAGDNYSNLQKFQRGLNPTNYYNPNGPPGFFGYLDATGTNVFIAWSPAPGPVVNYSIQRGIFNSLSGLYGFSQVGTVSPNASFIEDVGAINNSNALNNIYQLEAVYPAGSLSATDTWQVSWYGPYGSLGAPYGPPTPTNFYACADTSATNVLLSWSPASSVATNYLIERGIFNSISYTWVYHQIASVSPATNSLTVSLPFTNSANWSDNYSVVAIYPGGVQTPWAISPVNVGNTNGVVGPGHFFGYADGTTTNLVLAWTPAAGSPTNYVIFAGTTNVNGTCAYVKLTTASSGATSMLVTNGYNNLYQAYAIFATYTNGSMSQPAFWQSANGTPVPGNFIAYFDASGTNVWLSWTAPTGAITGYLIARFDPYGEIYQYQVAANVTSFEDTNAVNTGSFDPNYTEYTVQSIYPRGGVSSTAIAMVSSVPTPTGLSAALDVTGKNVTVTWNAVLGATGYVIDRGVLNPATGGYGYSQIATVGAGVTSYMDNGAITSVNSYNNHYKVAAIFPGGVDSAFDDSSVSESSDVPLSNVYITANLIRNGSGRWQIMFSGLPTNSPQTIQITWGYGYFPYYIYPIVQTNISTANLIGGVFQIPDALAANLESYFGADEIPMLVTAQLFGPNGEPGQTVLAGYFANDAPYFVDGRRHIKQNLQFLICAAARNQLFGSVSNHIIDGGQFNRTETGFEEFSFLNHSAPWYEDMYYFQLDNLWPFRANYDLANYLVYTTGTNAPYVNTNFVFRVNFATNIPAPAILGLPGQFPILQRGFYSYLQSPSYGSLPSSWGLTINSDKTSASQSSGNNLFGLSYNSGYLISHTNGIYSYQSISSGGNVTVPAGYVIDDYASWCPAPTLSLVNYYFAPLINPGMNVGSFEGVILPGELDADYGIQPFSVPLEEDFNVTNQTPPIIASVGQPMVIGGWAKYSVSGSSKFGYLGQYFLTNVFLLSSNGIVTTNTAGVMSPYGEFFPLQTGTAQFMTMPDIDNPSQQGTGVVKIISMSVDANHDGTLDFSYAGPDQNSPSRPFRFWANDNQDAGDFGGNYGVPGYLPSYMADGNVPTQTGYGLGTIPVLSPPAPNPFADAILYQVHGRRDLVDFFPVFLNIGSLFQSNALSAGISPIDPNYNFVLSQADGVLRFVYTDLTPTNYMNFLRNTNESGRLASATAWPIPASGIRLAANSYFATNTFLSGIATNNQGIILVEAAAPTTQPLVLTIYHGTNQVAQAQLYLSITGVEQMFRHKNLMLNPNDIAPGDRLTDASVPNEPDTIDKNFVFLHGYNVNTNEARGVASDMFKRMYWSGSRAKFWAVTWEGADSKIGSIFTPNYHTNVVHAFATAPNLANFIASLTSSGPVVVAAHSLGNMVVMSAISDWHAPISQFFMMDAAVPIEAIDPASISVPFMTFSTWAGYSNRLFAADWCQLFPTNDARSTLFWNNRLGNLGNVDVYNFYSSGEEVLRLTAGDPPLTTINIVATQLINWSWPGILWPKVPFGTYSWYWQEKGKGTCNEDGLIGSSHGGWKFNLAYETNFVNGAMLAPSAANLLPNSQLQTNAFVDWASTGFGSPDLALYGTAGSAYAQTNRNRILSDAIPAMSLVAGANPVPLFRSDHNIDMMTLKNGWAQGRTDNEAGMWHHSDFVQMAYTYTYQLFNQFVITGNLK